MALSPPVRRAMARRFLGEPLAGALHIHPTGWWPSFKASAVFWNVRLFMWAVALPGVSAAWAALSAGVLTRVLRGMIRRNPTFSMKSRGEIEAMA
mmetsp:Transcript_15154/g.38967  ORF Transcript_15154/g.38967 Transcript_15154/m.38967 type:complete len:95 (+) Transcript_15154:528-812(+)